MRLVASKYRLIDTHCHLYETELLTKVGQWVRTCAMHWIVPGYDVTSSKAALHLTVQAPERIHAAVGIHPHWTRPSSLTATAIALQEMLAGPLSANIVAIGESGLDFSPNPSTSPSTQEDSLVIQIALANCFQKPMLLHVVRAHTRLCSLLRIHPIAKAGVLHRFTRHFSVAKPFLDQGFCIGISLEALHDSRSKLRETIRYLPLDRLLIESDAPHQRAVRTGKCADDWTDLPDLLYQLYGQIAYIKQCPVERLVEQIAKNYEKYFLQNNG